MSIVAHQRTVQRGEGYREPCRRHLSIAVVVAADLVDRVVPALEVHEVDSELSASALRAFRDTIACDAASQTLTATM